MCITVKDMEEESRVSTLPMRARELAAALARADDARLMSLEARMAAVEASVHSLLLRITQLAERVEQLRV